ncbi:ras-domain-containing protein [Gigaspora margarita]|uniref:Ras-domain-containing protein n=1 Tax=Gigaspora margarita TaxID=4874 RepID=A0A8H3X6G0_GIGMA|nr:ras-domain-containing protein [Gigaspora margarita]
MRNSISLSSCKIALHLHSNTHRLMAQSKSAAYDYLIKLLLTGDSDVGKSAFLLRFSDDSFTPPFLTTIGMEFKIRTIMLDGKRIKFQIWDTPGQERFRSIITAYYSGAMGILLVYDVTNKCSFNNIRNWFYNIEQHASEGVNKILIGNKCDCVEKRVITKEQGQALADEYGIKFLEVSAKANINVKEAFLTLTRIIIKLLYIDRVLLINYWKISNMGPKMKITTFPKK